MRKGEKGREGAAGAFYGAAAGEGAGVRRVVAEAGGSTGKKGPGGWDPLASSMRRWENGESKMRQAKGESGNWGRHQRGSGNGRPDRLLG